MSKMRRGVRRGVQESIPPKQSPPTSQLTPPPAPHPTGPTPTPHPASPAAAPLPDPLTIPMPRERDLTRKPTARLPHPHPTFAVSPEGRCEGVDMRLGVRRQESINLRNIPPKTPQSTLSHSVAPRGRRCAWA